MLELKSFKTRNPRSFSPQDIFYMVLNNIVFLFIFGNQNL